MNKKSEKIIQFFKFLTKVKTPLVDSLVFLETLKLLIVL